MYTSSLVNDEHQNVFFACSLKPLFWTLSMMWLFLLLHEKFTTSKSCAFKSKNFNEDFSKSSQNQHKRDASPQNMSSSHGSHLDAIPRRVSLCTNDCLKGWVISRNFYKFTMASKMISFQSYHRFCRNNNHLQDRNYFPWSNGWDWFHEKYVSTLFRHYPPGWELFQSWTCFFQALTSPSHCLLLYFRYLSGVLGSLLCRRFLGTVWMKLS